jgi:hypothetical protein
MASSLSRISSRLTSSSIWSTCCVRLWPPDLNRSKTTTISNLGIDWTQIATNFNSKYVAWMIPAAMLVEHQTGIGQLH